MWTPADAGRLTWNNVCCIFYYYLFREVLCVAVWNFKEYHKEQHLYPFSKFLLSCNRWCSNEFIKTVNKLYDIWWNSNETFPYWAVEYSIGKHPHISAIIFHWKISVHIWIYSVCTWNYLNELLYMIVRIIPQNHFTTGIWMGQVNWWDDCINQALIFLFQPPSPLAFISKW